MVDKYYEYEHYSSWRKSRLDVTIDYYGLNFFKEKSLLEIGCGFGHIGNEFYKIGCNVTVSDARVELINKVNIYYPHLKTQIINAESAVWEYYQDFDVIVHWGLLYHLKNPDTNLSLMCKHCKYLILESEVIDSSEEYIVFRNEKDDWDCSFSGIGCTPSYGWIENQLKINNFKFDRLENPKRANADIHHYDWIRENNYKFKIGQRAFWFCERK